MKEFTYTVTRTRTITERLVLSDSPKAFIDKFDAGSQADAALMVQGMLKLRQHGKLLWEETGIVIGTPTVQIDVPVPVATEE